MRPKFSSSVQFSYTDAFKKIQKHQDVVSILPYAKDQIWTSHVCGFSLSAGSVIRGVIFLMRSLISSHGYKATLWDYQINKIQGWPIEMEHLRMQWVPTKKYFRQNFPFDLRTFWRSSKFYAELFSNICLGPTCVNSWGRSSLQKIVIHISLILPFPKISRYFVCIYCLYNFFLHRMSNGYFEPDASLTCRPYNWSKACFG